jgi:hypothetical protein
MEDNNIIMVGATILAIPTHIGRVIILRVLGDIQNTHSYYFSNILGYFQI